MSCSTTRSPPPNEVSQSVVMATRGPSVRTLPAQYHPDGLRHDPQIEPQRPVVDVRALEAYDVLEVRDEIAAANLPRPRQSRHHAQPDEMSRLVLPYLARHWRPRADERHVPREHVEQLRQLVEAEPAQHSADTRHARIILQLEEKPVRVPVERRQLLPPQLRLERHASELPHHELAAAQSHAALTKEHGTARVELDRDRDQRHERRADHQTACRQREIGRTLERHGWHAELGRMHVVAGERANLYRLRPAA